MWICLRGSSGTCWPPCCDTCLGHNGYNCCLTGRNRLDSSRSHSCRCSISFPLGMSGSSSSPCCWRNANLGSRDNCGQTLDRRQRISPLHRQHSHFWQSWGLGHWDSSYNWYAVLPKSRCVYRHYKVYNYHGLFLRLPCTSRRHSLHSLRGHRFQRRISSLLDTNGNNASPPRFGTGLRDMSHTSWHHLLPSECCVSPPRSSCTCLVP